MKDLNMSVTLQCTGIIRTLDSIGRVVVPVEWRKFYGIETSTEVEMIMTDKGILIVKPETGSPNN